MAAERLAIPELARVFDGGTISGLSEWQLLERYLERRDEAAFEALVIRHGPMVLGVCRRALGFTPDAEDAFQATFLILVRRARDLGPRDAIGPWLYGVARRVAIRARIQAARRRRHEAVPHEPAAGRPEPQPDPDLSEVLDQELNRLPARYRSPMVLCYIEGRTHEEAARDLGWPVGTVKGRLARARDILRDRLSRRGFAPMAGAILAVSSPDLRAILDRAIVDRAVGASARLAAGHSVAQFASQSITSLVEGGLSAMLYRKITIALLATLTTGFAFTTAAVLGRQATPAKDHSQAKEDPALDEIKSLMKGRHSVDEVKAIMKKHGLSIAEVRRLMEKASPRRKDVSPSSEGEPRRFVAVAGGEEPGRSDDPRSRQILAKLEEPISMSFANETPLDDVLKYIKQATTSPTFNGIPIYVDPIGLQEAERSMNSTISIDLEGVPLRRTLQLILTQLGLVYYVEDGFLVITSAEPENTHLPPSMHTPSPFMKRMEKAERGELSAGEMKELIELMKLRRQLILMQENMNTPYGGTGGPGSGADRKVFPGEEKVNETSELLGEIRELIRLLKAEKQAEKPVKSDEPERKPVKREKQPGAVE